MALLCFVKMTQRYIGNLLFGNVAPMNASKEEASVHFHFFESYFKDLASARDGLHTLR